MEALITDKWAEFYQSRVNNKEYLRYFEKRYWPLFMAAKALKPGTICEEGIGIGNVSKILSTMIPNITCYGFDNSEDMLNLCRENNPDAIVWHSDILKPVTVKHSDIVITHGVLEHFSDQDIRTILDRYKLMRTRHIHYVPTNKYETQSFGDERLLSPMHWLKLMKPKDYVLFNDNHDLLLIC
jgi:2-polyprenyl-3-methyl-5-hydroxy-6-metoxy-1,4-benzoquinol methylase